MKFREAAEIGRRVLKVKALYTKKDVDAVILASLFDSSLFNGTATVTQAKRVVKCFATLHEADWSKYLSKE